MRYYIWDVTILSDKNIATQLSDFSFLEVRHYWLMELLVKRWGGTWNEGRGGWAGTGLGWDKNTGTRQWRKGLVVKLRNLVHRDDEEEAIYSECDLIRSFHLFNPDFSLAQLGLEVTLEFPAPVIGWETQRQPCASGERTRLVAAGYWEFLSCLGDDCFAEFKGKMKVARKTSIR